MQRHGKRRRRTQEADPHWVDFLNEDEKREKELEEARALSLADVNLPVRTVNTLEGEGIFTVGQLAEKTKDELLEIKNFGETTLVEVRTRLNQLGVPHPTWNRSPRRKKR